jgi:hypothetical protein
MHSSLLRHVAGTFLLLLLLIQPSKAQQYESFIAIEDSLLIQYNAILTQDPFLRDSLAEKFFTHLYSALLLENSYGYPFDSLSKIGKVISPDKRIRIFTWNIPVGMNENLYFGIIQYYSKLEKKYTLVSLNDSIDLGHSGTKASWSKTLYFQIVETKHGGQKYYTLLGFDFYTPFANQKTIDVISIDDFDILYFCQKLFHYDGKMQDRLVFEYNEKAIMILRYDRDNEMIVFDHLAPSKPSLKDKYEFYGPDFTYDGLKFEKGIWEHYSNIDITN